MAHRANQDSAGRDEPPTPGGPTLGPLARALASNEAAVVLFARIAAAVAVAVTALNALGGALPDGTVARTAALVLVCVGVVVGVRRYRLPPAVGAHVIVGLTLALVTVAALRRGGLTSPSMVWYPVALVMSIMMLPKRAVLGWLGVIIALHVYLGYRQPVESWEGEGGTIPFYVGIRVLGLAALYVFVEAFASSRSVALAQASDKEKGLRRAADELFVLSRALMRAQTRANAAREEAERAASAKGAFLANMSHEIRTPMNAVLGVGALLDRTPLSDEQRTYVKTLQSSGTALLEIIDDILDFSKLDAGKFSLVAEPVDLHALVHDTARLLRVTAEAKGLSLDVEISDGIPAWVVGDAGRLRQVLVNLLGNAIKFSAQGTVTVRVGRSLGANSYARGVFPLSLDVCDTGMGMTKAQIARIFDAFTQADESTTRTFGGTGLGLAISRGFVEAMGGKLSAQSEPGRGSQFTVELPLTTAQAPAPEKVRRHEDDALEGHVLLVEDNQANQLIASHLLRRLGLSVTVASDGRAALEAVRDQTFDVVLMDCHMPEMDGFEATRAIRQRESEAGLERLPIIALTASTLADDVQRCHAAGMDGFLAKPLVVDALVQTLRHHVRETANRLETPDSAVG